MKRLTIVHINKVGTPLFPAQRDVSMIKDDSTTGEVNAKVIEFETLYTDRKVIDVKVDKAMYALMDPYGTYSPKEEENGDGK